MAPFTSSTSSISVDASQWSVKFKSRSQMSRFRRPTSFSTIRPISSSGPPCSASKVRLSFRDFFFSSHTHPFFFSFGWALGLSPSTVVNWHSNKVTRLLGKGENTQRFLRLALFQGKPKTAGSVMQQLGVAAISTSGNAIVKKSEARRRV